MENKIYPVIPASQFLDVSDNSWKNRACGIVSLFMAMSFFKPDIKKEEIPELIEEGVESGAYIQNIGWSHKGLLDLARKHSLGGGQFDYSSETLNSAFKLMMQSLALNPVLASIYHNFDPNDKGGHLILIYGYDEYDDGSIVLYIADPEAKNESDILYKIPKEKFLQGWKKRFIAITNKQEISESQYKIETLINFARGLIGMPYEDGMYFVNPQENQKRFDCSSLIQYVFQHIGKELPRTTILQAASQGEVIEGFENAKPGDVFFFEGDRGHYRHDLFPDKKLYIGHVGIYTGNNMMIHATRNQYFSGVVEHDLNPETNPIYNKNTIVYIKRFI